jgi:flagellar hook-length control protein FliK
MDLAILIGTAWQTQTPNAPAASQAITPPPTGASETPIAASPSVAPTAAPTPAPAAIPTPIAAPVAATPPPLAPPPQTRAPQTPEAKPTAESGKSAAAPTSQGAAKAPNGAQAQTNVAQPAQTADFGAFALSDAPDALAQAQSNAAAITTQTAASAQHASAVEQVAQRAAPAAAQLSREIIRRFDGGNTRFEFRLDPPELGRVEIKLEVTRDHRVSAVISADNPAALSDLARHARELEQSLQSAGLDLSENGLSFDLREGGDEAGDTSGDAGKSRSHSDGAENDALSTNTPQTARLERWRGTRIDVMA